MIEGKADARVMVNRPSYYYTMKNYRQRMSDRIVANNKMAMDQELRRPLAETYIRSRLS